MVSMDYKGKCVLEGGLYIIKNKDSCAFGIEFHFLWYLAYVKVQIELNILYQFQVSFFNGKITGSKYMEPWHEHVNVLL